MPAHNEAIDDLGIPWRFDLDAPAAIATACRDSVRRWRLRRIGEAVPGLIPEACDVGAPTCEQGTVLVDFAHVLAPLTAAKGAGARSSEFWDPRWKGELTSALSGGQWSQARKAAVLEWGIEDSKCQLCKLETGTLQHRAECGKTMPPGGWPKPPKEAARLLDRISAQRRRILETRGLLVLKLPAPPQAGDGHFTWKLQPDCGDTQGTKWYFDGSMLNGTWKPYRSTGFGVVVTSRDGQLLGYGNGMPPHWCKTAASAEAWALCTILMITPFPPQMRTDCLSLLATAREGHAKATDPRSPLARIWCMISGALEGDLEQLDGGGLLVWMPAHQSIASVGEGKLSSGARLSMLDWRANRLVDALAKEAAAEHQPPPAVAKLLHSAKSAVKHYAMLLGRITHAANHHPVTVVGPDGQLVAKNCRDSVDRPRVTREKAVTKRPQPKEPATAQKAPKLIKPWQPSAADLLGRTPQRSRAAEAKRASSEQLHRRVQEIGQALQPPQGGLTASQRCEALRARVLARAGHT